MLEWNEGYCAWARQEKGQSLLGVWYCVLMTPLLLSIHSCARYAKYDSNRESWLDLPSDEVDTRNEETSNAAAAAQTDNVCLLIGLHSSSVKQNSGDEHAERKRDC